MSKSHLITISDVAREAGVSKATASKVLSDPLRRYHVSDETREKVQAATRKLDYQVDWRASARARKRTRHVGLLVEWLAPFTDGAYEQALTSLAEALGSDGYDLLLVPNVRTPQDWERQRHDQRLDGIIAVQPTAAGMRNFLSQPGIPVVVVNQRLDLPVDTVLTDDAGGMRQAVEHMLAIGHRRIAYYGAAAGEVHYSQDDRRTAFHSTMAAHEVSSGLETHDLGELEQLAKSGACLLYTSPSPRDH
jgi:LacI family transcriptional regulator